MKHLVFSLFCCIGSYQSVTFAQTDSIVTYEFWDYGFPSLDIEARWHVGERWSIFYIPVAGCQVSEKLMDSVSRHNKMIEEQVVARYGADWQARFDREVEAEFDRENNMIEIVSIVPYISRKQEALEEEGNGLHYSCEPIRGTNDYHVDVCGWHANEAGKHDWVRYYRVHVKAATKRVTLLSDEIVVQH